MFSGSISSFDTTSCVGATSEQCNLIPWCRYCSGTCIDPPADELNHSGVGDLLDLSSSGLLCPDGSLPSGTNLDSGGGGFIHSTEMLYQDVLTEFLL